MKIELGCLYKHRKGMTVAVRAFVKMKINGEWVEGVMYTENYSDAYVRTISDFDDSFSIIKGHHDI